MKTSSFALLASLLLGCGAVADPVADPDDNDPSASSGGANGGTATPGSPTGNGLPCERAHGTATLTNYTGDNYPLAGFSFELASQDPAITRNAPDVYYERNSFMVGGDRDASFLVDLGAMELRDAPASVRPEEYPTGTWGKHDAIQAHPGHVYFLRGVSWHGRITAAFRVVAIDPGRRVTLEWIRSSDPETMVVPLSCLSGG
jgi:hypothetical protein